MFGGYDGERCFNSVEVLDIETMTWIKPAISGTVPLARNAHTMTVIGTKLYLFGGHSGNKHLTDLHIFDTQTLTWSEVSTLGTPPKGLRGHTANLIGTKIFIFGGYDGRGRSNDSYYLETQTLRWNHPGENESTPSGRQRHSACVIRNNQMLIFGGFDGNKWLNDIYILDVGALEMQELETSCVKVAMKNMRKIINEQKFSDITLIVEGKPLYAHKAILSSQCEHFRAMFLNGMKESMQNEIEIKDWTYNVYLQMIEYLYTGFVEGFNVPISLDLIGLADAYNLDGLKKMCERMMEQHVDEENVGDLLIVAHKYSVGELKRFCMNYLVKNCSEINVAKTIEGLESYPSLLIEVTKALFSKKEAQNDSSY